MTKPEMIKEIIEVVDALDMPPEDETPLRDEDREKLIASLKGILEDLHGKLKKPRAQN